MPRRQSAIRKCRSNRSSTRQGSGCSQRKLQITSAVHVGARNKNTFDRAKSGVMTEREKAASPKSLAGRHSEALPRDPYDVRSVSGLMVSHNRASAR